jgi:DNA-binding response OmpR family regulator
METLMKALIVDDDLALADVISFTFRRAGFEVIVAHDGQTAYNRWKNDSPDIIILDLNLPKMDGLSVCRQVRIHSDIPIIILTVRGEEDDIVRGLELGADDYVVKPFSPRQVIARAEAVLRRSGVPLRSPSPVCFGDLVFDPSRCEVRRGMDRVAHLTQLESRLLEILILNVNQVLLTDTLIDQVWGPSGGNREMLKQLIYRLRRKIESNPANPIYIETVPGVGYSFAYKVMVKS